MPVWGLGSLRTPTLGNDKIVMRHTIHSLGVRGSWVREPSLTVWSRWFHEQHRGVYPESREGHVRHFPAEVKKMNNFTFVIPSEYLSVLCIIIIQQFWTIKTDPSSLWCQPTCTVGSTHGWQRSSGPRIVNNIKNNSFFPWPLHPFQCQGEGAGTYPSRTWGKAHWRAIFGV